MQCSVDIPTYQNVTVLAARFGLGSILKMRLDYGPHLPLQSDQLHVRDRWGAWSSHLIDLPIPSLSVIFGAARVRNSLEKAILRSSGCMQIAWIIGMMKSIIPRKPK